MVEQSGTLARLGCDENYDGVGIWIVPARQAGKNRQSWRSFTQTLLEWLTQPSQPEAGHAWVRGGAEIRQWEI